MARVNVYKYAEDEDDETTLNGWFNPGSSTKYDEATRWDGNNNVSVNPVGKYGHQALYRTKGGKWVLNNWSQWQGSEDRYEFIGGDAAKDWLLRNEEDDAVEQYFGELEEESGPNLGGRPSIGPKVEVRLPKQILDRVDAFRGTRDRADALRDLIAAGLGALAATEK
jgi:hypothetical protein